MINYLANPARFLRFAKFATPVFAVLWVGLLAYGLYLALFVSPAAEEHGETVRILYIHVPAAWASMMTYMALAVASLVSFIWRHPLADSAAKAFALPGAGFTFLALATGSLWGRPAWGTYWQWDGRMTSVLIMLFIYLGYIAIWKTIADRRRAARLAGILAMVGVVNIPIIKFSVDWWNTLHQPASVSALDAPGLPPEFLIPMLTIFAAYCCLLGWLKDMQADIAIMRKTRMKDREVAKPVIEVL